MANSGLLTQTPLPKLQQNLPFGKQSTVGKAILVRDYG